MLEKGLTYYGYQGYSAEKFAAYIFSSPGIYHAGKYTRYYQKSQGRNIIMPIESTAIKINEKPELLSTAKKIWLHPNCTVPRDMVRKKYKTCKTAWDADAVILPNISFTESEIYEYKYTAVFVNDEAKKVYICLPYHNDSYFDTIKNAPAGTPLEEFLQTIIDVPKEVLESKLEYFGEAAEFSPRSEHIYDYLTLNVPPNKVVLESSLLKVLNGEDNTPTLEALLSIIDMLKSSEADVQDIGIKTLASYDYIHYPETFTYLIGKYSDVFRHAKASKSTIARCMFKSLKISLGRYTTTQSEFISKKDYNLMIEMIKAMDKVPEEMAVSSIYYLNFMYKDDDLKIKARFLD